MPVPVRIPRSLNHLRDVKDEGVCVSLTVHVMGVGWGVGKLVDEDLIPKLLSFPSH